MPNENVNNSNELFLRGLAKSAFETGWLGVGVLNVIARCFVRFRLHNKIRDTYMVVSE